MNLNSRLNLILIYLRFAESLIQPLQQWPLGKSDSCMDGITQTALSHNGNALDTPQGRCSSFRLGSRRENLSPPGLVADIWTAWFISYYIRLYPTKSYSWSIFGQVWRESAFSILVAICLYGGVKPAPSLFKPWDSPDPIRRHTQFVQAAMLLPPMQHFLQHFQGSFHIQLPRNQEPAPAKGKLDQFLKHILDLRCEQENQGINQNHQMNQVLLSNEISKEHLPALSLVVNTPCLCAVDLIHHPTQTWKYKRSRFYPNSNHSLQISCPNQAQIKDFPIEIMDHPIPSG